MAAAAAAAPLPPLPAPALPHAFTRVNMPGLDNRLDYVAVDANAGVVKGLPELGWVDTSSMIAGSRAAPFLSIAGEACRPAHFGAAPSPAIQAMLDLSEITATFTLSFVERCCDALEGLKVFDVPLRHTSDFDDKLLPALARVPSPSPFEIGAGDLYECNAFYVAGTPAVAGVAGRAAVPAQGRAGRAGYIPRQLRVLPVAPVAAVPARDPPDLKWWSLVKIGDSLDSSSEMSWCKTWTLAKRTRHWRGPRRDLSSDAWSAGDDAAVPVAGALCEVRLPFVVTCLSEIGCAKLPLLPTAQHICSIVLEQTPLQCEKQCFRTMPPWDGKVETRRQRC